MAPAMVMVPAGALARPRLTTDPASDASMAYGRDDTVLPVVAALSAIWVKPSRSAPPPTTEATRSSWLPVNLMRPSSSRACTRPASALAVIRVLMSSTRKPRPLLPLVRLTGSVSTASRSVLPFSTISLRLVAWLRCPSANSAKPSAISSCVQAGVSTDMSPLADRVMVLFSRQVRNCTLPWITRPSSAQGSWVVTAWLLRPPRTSMVWPASKSRPRVIFSSARMRMAESPSKVRTRLPR